MFKVDTILRFILCTSSTYFSFYYASCSHHLYIDPSFYDESCAHNLYILHSTMHPVHIIYISYILRYIICTLSIFPSFYDASRAHDGHRIPTEYPARGRVGRVTDSWVRGLGFKSPGSILTSRSETSSPSLVVRDGWDPCSVPVALTKLRGREGGAGAERAILPYVSHLQLISTLKIGADCCQLCNVS